MEQHLATISHIIFGLSAINKVYQHPHLYSDANLLPCVTRAHLSLQFPQRDARGLVIVGHQNVIYSVHQKTNILWKSLGRLEYFGVLNFSPCYFYDVVLLCHTCPKVFQAMSFLWFASRVDTSVRKCRAGGGPTYLVDAVLPNGCRRCQALVGRC